MKTAATTLYPFVPAGPDFQVALEFFTELGFAQQWSQPGLAGLRNGGAYFILQEANVREWQENQMITFEVTDLDAYWDELGAKNLPVRFVGVRIKPPIDFPWGREMHVIDPAGVCWHIRQAKETSS